ncbi:MAG: hypothetical protein HOH80_02280, partial [Rhodospirillaceae bacterium]|nr:hypothetical protein [Rhodospirillaceae bacterium]
MNAQASNPQSWIPPDSGMDDDTELLEAQADVRHLRKTIIVLREELEGMRFEKDTAVQQAIQGSFDEITQLKSTATSLRDELESLGYEKDAAVQQAIQGSSDEITQIKSTAT